VCGGSTFKYLITLPAEIEGKTSIYMANPVDDYVYRGRPWGLDETGFAPIQDWANYIDQSEKTVDVSHRLTKLLNTCWDVSRCPLADTWNDAFGALSLNVTGAESFASLMMP
jgi:hypothetical protein